MASDPPVACLCATSSASSSSSSDFNLLPSSSPLVIGRSAQCSIRLNDARISSVHCKIEIRPHSQVHHAGNVASQSYQFILIDSSSNGTFVNGKRSKKGAETELKGGEKIIFAKRMPSVQSARKPKPTVNARTGEENGNGNGMEARRTRSSQKEEEVEKDEKLAEEIAFQFKIYPSVPPIIRTPTVIEPHLLQSVQQMDDVEQYAQKQSGGDAINLTNSNRIALEFASIGSSSLTPLRTSVSTMLLGFVSPSSIVSSSPSTLSPSVTYLSAIDFLFPFSTPSSSSLSPSNCSFFLSHFLYLLLQFPSFLSLTEHFHSQSEYHHQHILMKKLVIEKEIEELRSKLANWSKGAERETNWKFDRIEMDIASCKIQEDQERGWSYFENELNDETSLTTHKQSLLLIHSNLFTSTPPELVPLLSTASYICIYSNCLNEGNWEWQMELILNLPLDINAMTERTKPIQSHSVAPSPTIGSISASPPPHLPLSLNVPLQKRVQEAADETMIVKGSDGNSMEEEKTEDKEVDMKEEGKMIEENRGCSQLRSPSPGPSIPDEATLAAAAAAREKGLPLSLPASLSQYHQLSFPGYAPAPSPPSHSSPLPQPLSPFESNQTKPKEKENSKSDSVAPPGNGTSALSSAPNTLPLVPSLPSTTSSPARLVKASTSTTPVSAPSISSAFVPASFSLPLPLPVPPPASVASPQTSLALSGLAQLSEATTSRRSNQTIETVGSSKANSQTHGNSIRSDTTIPLPTTTINSDSTLPLAVTPMRIVVGSETQSPPQVQSSMSQLRINSVEVEGTENSKPVTRTRSKKHQPSTTSDMLISASQNFAVSTLSRIKSGSPPPAILSAPNPTPSPAATPPTPSPPPSFSRPSSTSDQLLADPLIKLQFQAIGATEHEAKQAPLERSNSVQEALLELAANKQGWEKIEPEEEAEEQDSKDQRQKQAASPSRSTRSSSRSQTAATPVFPTSSTSLHSVVVLRGQSRPTAIDSEMKPAKRRGSKRKKEEEIEESQLSLHLSSESSSSASTSLFAPSFVAPISVTSTSAATTPTMPLPVLTSRQGTGTKAAIPDVSAANPPNELSDRIREPPMTQAGGSVWSQYNDEQLADETDDLEPHQGSNTAGLPNQPSFCSSTHSSLS